MPTDIELKRIAHVSLSVVCPRCMAERTHRCFNTNDDRRAFLELDEIHIERKERIKEQFDLIRSV